MAGYNTVHRTKKYYSNIFYSNYKKTREIKTSDVKRVNLVQIGLWIFWVVNKRKKMYHKGRPNFSFEIF